MRGFGLVSGFYTNLYAFGGISVIIILYGLLKKNLLSDNNIYFILSLVLSNLLLFFWILLTCLKQRIIFIYYIVIKYFDFKIIIILTCVNFMSWIINPQFLNIKYMSDICEPKHVPMQNLNLQSKRAILINFYFQRFNKLAKDRKEVKELDLVYH